MLTGCAILKMGKDVMEAPDISKMPPYFAPGALYQKRKRYMTLEALLSQLQFSDGVNRAVVEKMQKDRGLLKEIAETAYCGEIPDFALCRRAPLTRLAAVTCLLQEKYDVYRSLGVPDAVIFDTFRDVSLRANLYYRKHQKAGLSREDVVWFRHIMHAGIFKIGALQFQPLEMIYLDEETMGEPYMTFSEAQKSALPSGAPVLNCHVQRGADLSGRSVEAAFAAAREFFQLHFPSVHYRAFLCYSWLLYPPMVECLPAGSNIRRFAGKFTIIGACTDAEQALENLSEAGEAGGSGRETALQRMAAAHRERLGYACGIRPFDA